MRYRIINWATKRRNSVHRVLVFGLFLVVFGQCGRQPKEAKTLEIIEPSALGTRDTLELVQYPPNHVNAPEGMVWIPGGTFVQGAVSDDPMAMSHEKPAHPVAVDGFFMDIHEVTNADFAKFVAETGYITLAEREVDWEVLKAQLPEGTPKPHDSLIQPGSLTFRKAKSTVANLYDFSQWWMWRIGANWKHPKGPDSDIKNKENHPVVHIAYEDALAYCEWVGRRLPTEAEWEYAARGGHRNRIYVWGNTPEALATHANTWEGEFPVANTKTDGYEGSAPVKSYPPNEFGLYDMAGNVWEWTSDWYNVSYFKELQQTNTTVRNPKGAPAPYNPTNPYAEEKVIRGGSFLCNASYCASYRISARMATTQDSSLEHLGFRTVAIPEMVKN
ncbi:formylglycine-generating enzyme family protein [Arenibacter sp. GZD96]|uniref:formylglycine-generating enzyme family protein n=1 Tax=Aurantibrevibacter litoralis TaxID=3106030 RepID=UPI002AFEE77B|nr:formylglycine-generating enzyme family protein [Arenibacter sp. GZD-96]MEA1786020.1 formylglycine-generating enzyme family protein [Arenibacter sp. GZD-96]